MNKDNKKINEEEREYLNRVMRRKRKSNYFSAKLFFATLAVVFVIGLLIPLRPEKSDEEKRTLTKFPKFTIESFMNGEYLNGISTWYADTFPFRDTLIGMNAGIKSLYGTGDTKIVKNSVQTADEIPVNGENTAEQEKMEQEVKAEAQKKLEEKLPDGTIYDVPQKAGNVYVVGDRGFNLYYYSATSAEMYAALLDKIQRTIPNCNVYDLLVPTASGVILDQKVAQGLGASNQQDALRHIAGLIKEKNPNVKVVESLDNLLKHNAEYIYFRTDHHWTQTGAYYAYEEFAKMKGIEPVKLSDMDKVDYDGFIGSFYFSGGKPQSMKQNPDLIQAYKSKDTNEINYLDKNQQPVKWQVISDVTTWMAGAKYSTFIGGDNMVSVIDNPNISDGNNVLLIKESYGNSFAPFLIHHYDKVFIVDYRYFYKYSKYNNNIIQYIADNGIKDVIVLNNAEAAGSENNIKQMNAMFSH